MYLGSVIDFLIDIHEALPFVLFLTYGVKN
jgi:hypothetical protein